MTDDRQFMVPSYGALVERVSVLEGQLEVKAALLVGMAQELADARFKEETLEAELAELRAWKAEALDFPPADGFTCVERKVLRAVPEVPVTPAREV